MLFSDKHSKMKPWSTSISWFKKANDGKKDIAEVMAFIFSNFGDPLSNTFLYFFSSDSNEDKKTFQRKIEIEITYNSLQLLFQSDINKKKVSVRPFFDKKYFCLSVCS